MYFRLMINTTGTIFYLHHTVMSAMADHFDLLVSRPPPVRLAVYPSVTPKGVFLCALLFQSDKAVDFKTYANLLPTYCSCAPRIQFIRKSLYLVKIEVKTKTIFSVQRPAERSLVCASPPKGYSCGF